MIFISQGGVTICPHPKGMQHIFRERVDSIAKLSDTHEAKAQLDFFEQVTLIF